MCFFFQPLLQVLKFFFVHLCSSLQGTLHNLYSLLFFLVNIEDNVSFRLGEELEMICICFLFYVKFFFGGVIFSDFFSSYLVQFSKKEKKKRKEKKKCCFSKSFKSKFFVLLLSKEFHCFSCSTIMHMHFSHMNMFLG